MLQFFQQYKILHTLREGNRVADAFANIGLRQNALKLWDFSNLSNQIKEVLAHDILKMRINLMLGLMMVGVVIIKLGGIPGGPTVIGNPWWHSSLLTGWLE